jgi:hypothetical protein
MVLVELEVVLDSLGQSQNHLVGEWKADNLHSHW